MNIIILNKKRFKKQLEIVPPDLRKKVLQKITMLSTFPNVVCNVRKLRNLRVADYRMRVADFRVLFTVHKETQTIDIIAVLHRKDAYR